MDKFTEGYIECAVWSSTADDGSPLDSVDAELSQLARERMMTDCAAFQADNAALLDQANEHQNAAHQGHDFWLTRNGHGAGFWDGDYPEALGKALTDAAHLFGWCDLYVGDDGEIHIC